VDRKNLVLLGLFALLGIVVTRPAPAGSGKLIPPPVISSGSSVYRWPPCGPGFGRGC